MADTRVKNRVLKVIEEMPLDVTFSDVRDRSALFPL